MNMKQKAIVYFQKNPNASAASLAKRFSISKSYAHKLKAETIDCIVEEYDTRPDVIIERGWTVTTDSDGTLAGSIGRKFDKDKPDYTLLPWDAVEDVVRVLDFGAKKYARDNWKHVDDAHNRYLAAAFRHLSAYAQGEQTDAETGLNHMAHAACCVLFMLSMDKQKNL